MATIINAALVVGVALALIEVGQRKQSTLRAAIGNSFMALLRNPTLVAPLLALAYAATGLALPAPVAAFTGILGSAAGPCALFAIGLFLVGKPHSEVGVMTATKLLA